jgi:hypothetical protein
MVGNGVVVTDGRVDREKLDELLLLGAEHEALDFKRTLDLGKESRKDGLSFVRDCLAMASLPGGGYLIVGVEDNGSLALTHTPIVPAHFDSASLMQKVRNFIDQPLAIVSAVHVIEVTGVAHSVALVYVPTSPSGLPLPVTRNGEYTDERSNRSVSMLRLGEVVIREGTSTTHLAHRHWQRLLASYTDQVKAEARKDIDDLIRSVVESGGIALSTSGPPLVLEMDDSAFGLALMSASRAQIRAVLSQATDAGVASARGFESDLPRALDKIAIVGAFAVTHSKRKLLDAVVTAFLHVYAAAPRPSPYSVPLTYPADVATATLWREVVMRVMAVGAAAVRAENWRAVRVLGLVPFEDERDGFKFPSWIRHALVYASRANVVSSDGVLRGGLLLSMVRQYMLEHPAVRPDVPVFAGGAQEELPPTSIDSLLDSACQFDFLWCVAAAVELPDDPSVAFYTNCAAFNQARWEPAITLVNTNALARMNLTADASDDAIDVAVAVVLGAAHVEARRLDGTWRR